MRWTSPKLVTSMLTLALAGLGCGDTAHADPSTAQERTQAAPTTATPLEPSAPRSPHSAPIVVPPPPPAARAREVAIVGTGDLLIHQRVAEAARLHADEGGFAWSFAGLAQSIEPTDIAYLNLETPLTLEYRDPQSVQPPVLGAPPEVARALAGAGIDVVGIANNHVYDQTARGLAATLDRTREAGIVTVGAGHDEDAAYAPVYFERGGVRVAFVAFTDRLDSSPERWDSTVRAARLQNEPRLTSSLAEARAHADIVVVAVHWGEEFADAVARWQRQTAAHLFALGADVILGTGPHVLLPVERTTTPRGEGVVAYSLGNSISNQGLKYLPGHLPPGVEGLHEESPLPRDSVLLRVTMRIAPTGRVEIAALSGEPLWTQNNWRGRGRDGTEVVRIARLRDCDDTTRQERLAVIARTLGPAVTLEP